MRKIILVLIILTFVAVPNSVYAAVLELSSTAEKTLSVSNQFEVTLTLNTQDETLNAFSGNILFPSTSLALQSIRDGNSILSYWIEKPHEVPITTTTNGVQFSGTIPGGFKGIGQIFSLIFQVVGDTGNTSITATDLLGLKHDGFGTVVATTSTPLIFTTIKQVDTPNVAPAVYIEELQDNTPPHSFTVHVIQSESLHDNRWVAIFDTADPESGIDHYEIQESDSASPHDSGWTIASSPYLLQDQERKSWVHIKAVNRVGLSTISSAEPVNKQKPVAKIITTTTMAKVGIAVLILLFVPPYIWKIVRKYKPQRKSNYTTPSEH